MTRIEWTPTERTAIRRFWAQNTVVILSEDADRVQANRWRAGLPEPLKGIFGKEPFSFGPTSWDAEAAFRRRLEVRSNQLQVLSRLWLWWGVMVRLQWSLEPSWTARGNGLSASDPTPLGAFCRLSLMVGDAQ